ncbi:hypothetical protein EAG_06850 [Camponotus floridanus]|uniref:Uncharacterized protein n=1 Tax=Camponotus floridanus TaxID=104421 RepID=E2A1J3_CAMFO|nr:hypothetical protein EAG_06850 [Camponotus floridanus]
MDLKNIVLLKCNRDKSDSSLRIVPRYRTLCVDRAHQEAGISGGSDELKTSIVTSHRHDDAGVADGRYAQRCSFEHKEDLQQRSGKTRGSASDVTNGFDQACPGKTGGSVDPYRDILWTPVVLCHQTCSSLALRYRAVDICLRMLSARNNVDYKEEGPMKTRSLRDLICRIYFQKFLLEMDFSDFLRMRTSLRRLTQQMSKDFHVSMDKILYQNVRQSGRFFGALPPKSRVEKWGNTDRT